MKWSSIIAFLLVSVLMLVVSSCKEVGPNINLTDDIKIDTTYVITDLETPQQKAVLLEEFTGVRCVNCPQGHELIEDLESQYGNAFIAVSQHSEFLATPYDGDQDLRVPEAQQLEDFLGPAIAKPVASIDRVIFPGESDILQFLQKWPSFVSQRSNQTTPVNIHLQIIYNGNSRKLDVVTTLQYTSEVTEENRLSVMILEDGIITQQLGDGGIDSQYVQNQVLRDMLTPYNGILIDTTKEAGRVIVKRFTLNPLPTVWEADNLKIVAFVHKTGGSMEVYHAVEELVKP